MCLRLQPHGYLAPKACTPDLRAPIAQICRRQRSLSGICMRKARVGRKQCFWQQTELSRRRGSQQVSRACIPSRLRFTWQRMCGLVRADNGDWGKSLGPSEILRTSYPSSWSSPTLVAFTKSSAQVANAKRTSTWKQNRGYGPRNRAEKSVSLPSVRGSTEYRAGGRQHR